MAFIIGLLTFILVVDCLALILLVLIQLPKKEAGAGLAFGAGYTDALFGAGSGNVLTRATKYATAIFFVLALALGVMETKFTRSRTSDFQRELERQAKAPIGAQAPASKPAPKPTLEATPAVAAAAALPSNAPSATALVTNLLTVPPTAPPAAPVAPPAK